MRPRRAGKPEGGSDQVLELEPADLEGCTANVEHSLGGGPTGLVRIAEHEPQARVGRGGVVCRGGPDRRLRIVQEPLDDRLGRGRVAGDGDADEGVALVGEFPERFRVGARVRRDAPSP
jgi:hypothetical protein